ncbi:unnamed protein product, partial [Closterium sp. Naga37s-1]
SRRTYCCRTRTRSPSSSLTSAALLSSSPRPPPPPGPPAAATVPARGRAREGGEVLRDFMGTAFYAAPEVWRHAYGPQADVWSAGAVVAVLLTGPPPSGLTCATVHSNATWQAMQRPRLRLDSVSLAMLFHRTFNLHQHVHHLPAYPHSTLLLPQSTPHQKGIVPTLPSETSPAARSFLRVVLEPDPCQRPSAAHALLHPWLAGAAAGAAGSGAEVASGAIAGAVVVTGDGAGKWGPPAVVAPGASAGEEHTEARARGAAAEMPEEGMGKGGEEDGERSIKNEESGEREGEVAARRTGQEEEGVVGKGPAQGGAAAEGRVRGGVQLEGSLRGFRMYAATRKLQRACVALLSLELSESEFRQLVRQLASATSAPGTSLEAVSEAGGTVDGQSDDRGEQQQQQQQCPPSAMLSLPALLASLDALGHQRLSHQLMGLHSSVMPHSMLAHVPPTVTLQAGAVQSGSGAAGSSAAGGEREREGCVRGGSGIAATLGKQRQEQQQQQQQGAATTSLTHQPSVLPPSSSSLAIPPVPLFDLLDFSALVTRHHDVHRLHHHPHPDHPPHHQSVAHAAAAVRGAAGGGGRREGKGKGKAVSPEGGGKSVEGGSSHRGSRRFLGLMREGEGEKEGEGDGSVHGGSVHGGSVHGGSVHGGSVHGGSVHGGSLHGSRRFLSVMRAREGDQHEGGSSQHGSRRFFGLLGGREQHKASSGAGKEGGAGGSQHGSRRFFSMMHGSGAPSPAAAGLPSPGGSLRGSFRMARRLGLLRAGGEEGEGEEEDIASPGADGDVVGAMGARSAAPLALRGPLSPRSPSATAHSDNAGGWARRLNARASAGGAGMTWQSPVGPGKSPLALGVSPQSGERQQGRGVVGDGAGSGAAAAGGVGHADHGGLPGGVGMMSCQRVQSCVDLAAMGGDESSPAAGKAGTRGWGRGRGKGGFWGPVKGGVQGGGGVGGMNGKGTSVHGECLYREFLLSECTP